MFMLFPVDRCLYLFPTNPCVLLFLTSRGCDVQIFICFRLLGMYLYCLRSKVQWHMMMFLAKSSQSGRKRQIWHSFFWVQGTSLEGVPRETTILGGRGAVRCNLIYPCISMKATLIVKAKLFVPCFAIEINSNKKKKIQKKRSCEDLYYSSSYFLC